jgi:hypothetical protein
MPEYPSKSNGNMRILCRKNLKERKHRQVNKWLQSRMHVKRLYVIVGGGAIVLLLAFIFAALLMKNNTESPPTTGKEETNPPSQVKTEAATSSETTENEVVRVPLNKTLDEAKAEGLYTESTRSTAAHSGEQKQHKKSTPEETTQGNVSAASTLPADNSGQITNQTAAVPGQGLDANTVGKLRSHGIREGDLAKIDQLIAEGFDPKEIAQSLRKNGNPNLAAVIEQVPRKPKKEKKPKKEEKKKEQKENNPAGKGPDPHPEHEQEQAEDKDN